MTRSTEKHQQQMTLTNTGTQLTAQSLAEIAKTPEWLANAKLDDKDTWPTPAQIEQRKAELTEALAPATDQEIGKTMRMIRMHWRRGIEKPTTAEGQRIEQAAREMDATYMLDDLQGIPQWALNEAFSILRKTYRYPSPPTVADILRCIPQRYRAMQSQSLRLEIFSKHHQWRKQADDLAAKLYGEKNRHEQGSGYGKDDNEAEKT